MTLILVYLDSHIKIYLFRKGQTEDPDPEKHPVPLRLCSRMIEWINGFQIGVCIVKIMCNPALRDRHWVEMSEIAGRTQNCGGKGRRMKYFLFK